MSAKRRQEALKRFEQPLQQVLDLPPEETDDDDDDDDFIECQDEHAFPIKRSKGKTKGKQNTKQNPKVMLLSLKAGAFGLNLTVANNIYLCILKLFGCPVY
jgi:SWI/SNF-related matrix-associated actin-dependent regulator of chromatin subfamily A3